MSKSLAIIPRQTDVSAEDAAAKLRELISAANDGWLAIVRCGIYIEWLVAKLPHGEFKPWLEKYCPDIPRRTIYNWRNTAKNLMEWAGIKSATVALLPESPDRYLTLPADQVPEKFRRFQARALEAIRATDGPQQLMLFLGFKQATLDADGNAVKQRGRHKGCAGNPKAQRTAAQAAKERGRLEALTLDCEHVTQWLLEAADDEHLGLVEDHLIPPLQESLQIALDYVRRLQASRKGSRS